MDIPPYSVIDPYGPMRAPACTPVSTQGTTTRISPHRVSVATSASSVDLANSYTLSDSSSHHCSQAYEDGDTPLPRYRSCPSLRGGSLTDDPLYSLAHDDVSTILEEEIANLARMDTIPSQSLMLSSRESECAAGLHGVPSRSLQTYNTVFLGSSTTIHLIDPESPTEQHGASPNHGPNLPMRPQYEVNRNNPLCDRMSLDFNDKFRQNAFG